MNRKTFNLFGIIGVLLFANSLIAQQDSTKKDKVDSELDEKSKTMIAEAKSAYAEIGALVKKQDWDQVKKRMTPQGAKSFCVDHASILILAFEGGVGLEADPDIDVKKLKSIMEKFELTDEFKKALHHAETDAEFSTRIAKAIDKKGKRWEILSAAWKAQESFPNHVDATVGSIHKSIIVKDKVILHIRRTPLNDPPRKGGPGDRRGGLPKPKEPLFAIRMSPSKNGWQYDGIDEIRTRELEKKAVDDLNALQGGGGGKP